MTITWEQLLSNRKLMKSTRNSGHMLECIAMVAARYPQARILEIGEGEGKQYQLTSGAEFLSNQHNSHYECWMEARDILEQNPSI